MNDNKTKAHHRIGLNFYITFQPFDHLKYSKNFNDNKTANCGLFICLLCDSCA